MCLPSNVSGATIQCIATLVGIILCLNFGLLFGITPAHMQLYQTLETPLSRTIDSVGASWVCGHLFLSAAVGALVAGFLTLKIGPKSVLLLNGLLQITSWFCMHFGYNITHIYFGRIFGGLAGGATFVALPIFIAQITEDGNRVKLTFLIDQGRSLGILIGLVLGWYLPYEHVPIVGVCISIVFTMTFPFVQESPYYAMQKGNVANMEKSLRWFRGIRQLEDRDKPEYVRELAVFQARMKNTSMVVYNMSPSYLTKTFLLCLVLALGAQLNGVYVILNYADHIFTQASAVYPLHVNVLILAAVQLLGAFIVTCIGAHINRKILLFITSLICGLSLVSMALFVSFGKQWHLNPMYTPWLPLALLSLHMLSANIGLFPLSTVVIRELLPSKLYAIISSVVVGISWMILFLFIKYFDSIIEFVGLSACFWFFACICVGLSLCAWLFLPETRDRSAEYVQQRMGLVANGSVAKIAIISSSQISNEHI